MEQNEIKFEVTFKTSYTKEELDGMVEHWLKKSLEGLVDNQCDIDSFELKEIE